MATELPKSVRRLVGLARRERWPYAVLDGDLAVSSAGPSRARWAKLAAKLKLARRHGELVATWPRGTRGAAIALNGSGGLVLGPFAGRSGPPPAVLASMADLAREVTTTEEGLATRKSTLDAVLHIGHALSSIKDLGQLVAGQMVPELVHLLDADRGSVFLIDEGRQELYSLVALGAEIKEIRFPLDRGLAGHVAMTGETLNIPDAYADPRFNPEIDRRTGYHTKSVLCVPMVTPQGRRIGVVQVINKKNAAVFTHEDEEMLLAIASEATISILSVKLVEEQKALFDSFIDTMAAALDARDPLTAGHTHRVTEYSLGIARHLGFPRDQLERVRIAGMLHDMGKIGTPDHILKKPDKLTREEFEIIKQHAAYTRTIVKNLRLPAELQGLAEDAALHHERMDGSGYPDGRRADQIPIVARLMAVADVFDAITSRRIYREAMPIDQALDIIRQGSGSHFDPVCVEAFLKYFELELRGRFADASPGGAAR